MKQFFKFMFASMVGMILTIFLAFLIMMGVIGSIVSASKSTKTQAVSESSILHIQLAEEIQDRANDNPFENFDFESFETHQPLGLNMILKNIEKAKEDDRIKGIYLDLNGVKAGGATVEEIRNALLDFKESEKFIVAYSESYTQKSYYLSSVADKIYLHPSGDLVMKGLSAQLMFMKDAFEKLDIEMQVIRHGKFKSYVEPYVRQDMSPENREQLTQLIGSIWDHYLNGISESRSVSVDQLNTIADSLLIRMADNALEQGLIDGLKYEDEVKEELKELTEIEEDKKLKLVALSKYDNAKLKPKDDEEKKITKEEIAVIYASGEIRSGKSNGETMGSETIAEAIRKARESKYVKAIVLRVNSPGGSALASDVMWREMVLAKAEKPVVVSMGDVAASGGYYISCPGNKIFAESTTITGSIGVFGLIPNAQGLMNNKLGLRFDEVNTNEYSDGLTVVRPLANTEYDALLESVEKVYSDFIGRVAEGRGMTTEEVDKIGEGRVWSGIDAVRIGLVDEIGGLDDAIEAAAEMAELEDYRIQSFPKQEEPFEKLMKEFASSAKQQVLSDELGSSYKYYQRLQNAFDYSGILMRLPVEIVVH